MLAGSGALMIVGAIVFYTRDTPFPGAAALLPCLGAGLVIYGGLQNASAINRALSVRPIVLLGTDFITRSIFGIGRFLCLRSITFNASSRPLRRLD